MMGHPGYPFMKIFHWSLNDSLQHATICCTWEEYFALSRYYQDNNLYIGYQDMRPLGNW